MGIGTNINTDLEVLGNSQVCGQCHGSYTNVAGTMGLYGYTPNQPLYKFVDVNGASGGQSYTKIPTEDEFMATPTAFWMFPNGSNAKGNHYYYDEWAASAHSYRARVHQGLARGHDVPGGRQRPLRAGRPETRFTAGCYECHTGEGYLSSKDAEIAEGFTPDAPTTSARWARSAPCATAAIRPPSVPKTSCVSPTRPASAAPPASPKTTPASAWTATTGSTRSWAPSPTTRRRRTSRRTASPSHPQRETLRGYAMVEIDERRRVHAGRRVRRLPHAQDQQERQPHLPRHEAHAAGRRGDVDDRGQVRLQGEDSCSTCHAGADASELQYMDRPWQVEATDAGRDGRRHRQGREAQGVLADQQEVGRLHPGRQGHLELQGLRERRFVRGAQPGLHRGRSGRPRPWPSRWAARSRA